VRRIKGGWDGKRIAIWTKLKTEEEIIAR